MFKFIKRYKEAKLAKEKKEFLRRLKHGNPVRLKTRGGPPR